MSISCHVLQFLMFLGHDESFFLKFKSSSGCSRKELCQCPNILRICTSSVDFQYTCSMLDDHLILLSGISV